VIEAGLKARVRDPEVPRARTDEKPGIGGDGPATKQYNRSRPARPVPISPATEGTPRTVSPPAGPLRLSGG